MPFLSTIALTWFRNFEQKRFLFEAPAIGISGPNGIGKTNLLDAIYYLCYTKSYFQNKERNNIYHQYEGFRIEGSWCDGESTAITTCMYKEGKKSVWQDHVLYERVSEHIGQYHAVMIAPDDLSIINNGSDKRRKFTDGLLAQTNKAYLNNLLNYQKVLQQKNAYLKQTELKDFDWPLLDVYDEQLAACGSMLMEQRMQLASFLPEKIQEFYQQLSGSKTEVIGLSYQPCTHPDKLLSLLQENRQYDATYKRTVKGPHTEDWLFTLNGQPMKSHASQGQKKSFLISLKLAQLLWLQQYDTYPLLLMDDIFEKLDKHRIERLFGLLPSFRLKQLFLTHTEEPEMKKMLPVYNKDFQVLPL